MNTFDIFIRVEIEVHNPNLPFRALKFCETSAAESALLYIDACAMFPLVLREPLASCPKFSASRVVDACVSVFVAVVIPEL